MGKNIVSAATFLGRDNRCKAGYQMIHKYFIYF